jgi:glycosyltransferase involved in cell wall biosynthesis
LLDQNNVLVRFKNTPNRSEVAVILPCYNAEDYLQRSLTSVFTQSYSDWHVYAVDDGSTDHTVEILEANCSRCSFEIQRHGGPAAARNRAIEMSTSPFVAFLDADDEWLPQKLARQLDLLKQFPTLGLVCSLCVLQTAGKQTVDTFPGIAAPYSGRLFERLVRQCFIFTPTVVVRRRCLEDVGLFNESLLTSEDFNLWLRVAARWDIALLPELLAITHKRPGSLSAAIAPEKRLSNGVAAIADVRSKCPRLTRTEARALRTTLAERLYYEGSYLLLAGAKTAARAKLAEAQKLKITNWRAVAKLSLSILPNRVYRSILRSKGTLVDAGPSGNLGRFTPTDGLST